MEEKQFIISADGTRVGYIDEGSGRPIVIVHGGSGDVLQWKRVAHALVDRFRVIRIARRLYADDQVPQSPHAMAREVEDLEALLGRIDEPAILMGHSSGGLVALETALRSPAAIAGLALYEPPVAVYRSLGGDALLRARQALDRGDHGTAMAIHLRDIVGMSVPLLWILRHLPIWKKLIGMAPAQIADNEAIESLGVGIGRYAALRMPVLLFGGTRSPKHLRERLTALAEVIPGAETKILRGQGHVANLTAPATVAALLRAFAGREFSRFPVQA